MERISDYLLQGKGAWWTETETQNIKFFDISQPTTPTEQQPTTPFQSQPKQPTLLHFRSSNHQEIRLNLIMTWESCIDNKVELPSKTIRQYTRGN